MKTIGRYLIPGLVFQSVIVGGGYGTGREIAEFFVSHGPLGGLQGMLVAALVWGIILAVAFEFARITRAYDYRSFFRELLGRFWLIFEVVYLLIALLVLAVLGSAAGELLAESFGTGRLTGTISIMIAISALVYFGSSAVQKVLTYWSVLLYVAYAALFVWVLSAFGNTIGDQLASREVLGAWHLDGLRYAAYNLTALAATLFALSNFESRRQAVGAGLLAALIGIVPGIFVFISMLAQYPDIVAAPVPISNLLEALNAIWFLIVFQIILFGTFIETGAAIVHAINERIASAAADANRTFPSWGRAATAVGVLILAVYLADSIGIIALIAKGYGYLSYAFIAVVLLPLMTIGLRRILAAR